MFVLDVEIKNIQILSLLRLAVKWIEDKILWLDDISGLENKIYWHNLVYRTSS